MLPSNLLRNPRAALGSCLSMVMFCRTFNLSFVYIIVWFVLDFAQLKRQLHEVFVSAVD